MLTRKKGESIFIGDDITITVMNIDGGQVRLGVDAPRSLSVDRKEIRIKKEGGPVSGNV